MFKNILKIAYRNLQKQKVYTFINIFGLSVGATASMLIFLYVRQEHSYDNFYKDTDQLYRVAVERKYPDRITKFAFIPGGFSEVLKDEIPEIEKSTRIIGFPEETSVFKYEDQTFLEHNHFFADSNFFNVLDFRLLKGNPKTALKFSNTMVISESMARKYFGNEDPIGKTLEVDTTKYEVVAVIQDVPTNSHMKFDFLSSSTALNAKESMSYFIISAYTYIKLVEGANPQVVESKIPALVEKYAAGQIERALGITFKEYKALGNGYNYFLQPISSIHLHSQLEREMKVNGNIVYTNILISIGVLILFIAGINFINLATARSTERAKEVGVRKVLGSLKKQLIYQFLSESIFISIISIALAIALIQISLGLFNSVIPQPIVFTLSDGFTMAIVLSITLIMGLIAGLYPAFYISSLKPIAVLKGKLHSSSKGSLLRKGLIVFQFSISIVLISATLIVFQQLEYMQDKDLGFEKENILVIERNEQKGDMELIKEVVRQIPGVVSVGYTNSNPGEAFFGELFRQPGQSELIATKGCTIDDDFIEALQINTISGRTFSPQFNDSLSIMLNQAAVRVLGLSTPIGAKLENSYGGSTTTYTVIGVLEDFNFESLHSIIEPLVLFSTERQFRLSNAITVRVDPQAIGNVLPAIERKWKEIIPEDPFVYSFMDSNLNKKYSSEKTSGKILALFTAIAIMIACVGLFGLAAYAANQRTKEIGVRKILGASVPSILNLLSMDFTRLVVLSFMIGVPIAYFCMDMWLQSFAYKTPLTLISFATAGLLILIISYITISYQAFKAATTNPTNSLRNE